MTWQPLFLAGRFTVLWNLQPTFSATLVSTTVHSCCSTVVQGTHQSVVDDVEGFSEATSATPAFALLPGRKPSYHHNVAHSAGPTAPKTPAQILYAECVILHCKALLLGDGLLLMGKAANALTDV